MLAAAPAWAGSAETARHIDGKWFRHMLADEAARWRRLALQPSGFFAVSFDREWRPAGAPNGTLVSQSRQIYVMAAGYAATRDAAFRGAARRGADFLLRHFRDAEHGLYFYSVTPEGKVVDDGKDSYGLAFAIFGLSHAALATGDRKYAQAALDAWSQMKARLREENGFFRPKMDRAYTRTIGQNSQNPMMHLFEALLALHDATGSQEVLRDAEAHAEGIFTRLYDAREGRLPELYERDWTPSPPDRRGYLEIGHQFEWAYLLSRAVEKGLPRRYLGIGERLLNYGMRTGYDGANGGIWSRGDYEGNAVRGPKGWWEQAEFLRAVAHYAALRGRIELWPAFDRSLEFVRRHLIDPEHGGWYYWHDPTGARPRTSKGSVWQAGYHVCGMYAEALRLARLP
jgi:mannose/cellobiose epimerase-like protein (N-acyl-D-glucosamine 2-epimerase family)